MKLNDFLTAQGRSRPAPTRPVTFKVLGLDVQMQGLVADAAAELAFVPEATRQEALRDAERHLRETYGDEAAQKLDLSPTGYAIYGLLHQEVTWKAAELAVGYGSDERRRDLADLVEKALNPHLAIVDWQTKEDVQRLARRDVKRQLKVAGVPDDKVDALAAGILDLAKRRKGR
jgi:hypothetical protein